MRTTSKSLTWHDQAMAAGVPEHQIAEYEARQRVETYDQDYSTLAHQLENIYVRATLEKYVRPGDQVLDLGSGTGLGRELLSGVKGVRYTGVEPCQDMLLRAAWKFPEDLYHLGTAEEYLSYKQAEAARVNQDRGAIQHAIALWSLDYMDPAVVPLIARLKTGAFIAVHHNQPWRSDSNSVWYKGLRELFEWKHSKNKEQLLRRIKQAGGHTEPFIGRGEYYLSIIE